MTQLAENQSKEIVSDAVQKIKNVVENDKNLNIGLVHDIKEIGQNHRCYRVFSVTMEIAVSIPIGEPDSSKEEKQTIVFEQPTEFFEIVPMDKDGDFGMAIAGFYQPIQRQENYKSPFTLTIREATHPWDVSSVSSNE